MAFVNITDVQVRLGRALTVAEEAQVEAWIEDLEAIVLQRVPDLQERIDSGAISSAIVRSVLCSAIIRVMRNPGGLRQRTESIDDYSLTETVDSSLSTGALYLTDEEWGLLLPVVSGGAFSTRFYGEPDCRSGWWVHPDQWVPYP